MDVELFALRSPDKSALRLALAIQRATTIGGEASVKLAERLYDNQFREANPLRLVVRNAEGLRELRIQCKDAGIEIRAIGPGG